MHHNEVLHQICQALGLTDAGLVALFAHGGAVLTEEQAHALTVDPELPEGTACSDELLARFLDGLITERRGEREPGAPPVPFSGRLSNNAILKKLRIALAFHEPDMLRTFAAGGRTMSNRELTTLFRKPRTKHFRKCSDDVLRAFLDGVKASRVP